MGHVCLSTHVCQDDVTVAQDAESASAQVMPVLTQRVLGEAWLPQLASARGWVQSRLTIKKTGQGRVRGARS